MSLTSSVSSEGEYDQNNFEDVSAFIKTELMEPDVEIDIKNESLLDLGENESCKNLYREEPTTLSIQNFKNKLFIEFSSGKDLKKIASQGVDLSDNNICIKKQEIIQCDYEGEEGDFHGFSSQEISDYSIEITKCNPKFNETNHVNDDLPLFSLLAESDNLFRCGICQEGFSAKNSFIEHVRNHNEHELQQYIVTTNDVLKKFKCTLCEKQFSKKEHIVRHIRTHSGAKPFSCHVCNKSFTRKEYLNYHIRLHNDSLLLNCEFPFDQTEEKIYTCDVCNISFTESWELSAHMDIHLTEQSDSEMQGNEEALPFRCDTCGKHFSSRQCLLHHYKLHSSDAPFKCDYCSKTYTRKDHLNCHLKTHTGEGLFRCEFCQKPFIRKDHFLNHVRIHTGEKPHKCQYCEKSFGRKDHLNNHIKTHTGDKPFKCNFCPKTFSRKDHRKSHAKTHSFDVGHYVE